MLSLALQSTPIGNEMLTYLKVRYRRFIYCSILHEYGYRLFIISHRYIIESKDFDIQIHVIYVIPITCVTKYSYWERDSDITCIWMSKSFDSTYISVGNYQQPIAIFMKSRAIYKSAIFNLEICQNLVPNRSTL